jgi:hypothetical protein
MRRSTKLMAVYAEIRKSLGATASPTEAMELAHHIIAAFSNPEDGTRFDLRVGGVPFCMWGVDQAIADGGWRVLDRAGELAWGVDEEAVEQLDFKRTMSRMGLEVHA